MAQLSLEEFRSIKSRLSEIAEIVRRAENGSREITEEEGDLLTEEIEQLNATLHDSDLSSIPFEEYEGFVDLGIDFGGTSANLDYSLINTEYRDGNPVRNKGCVVRNFDFESMTYDGESFDEDFISEHQEHFLQRTDLPKEVAQRYYEKRLSTRDIIIYDLYDSLDRLSPYSGSKVFFEKVSPEVARTIDRDILLDDTLWRLLESKLLMIAEPITSERIEDSFISLAEDELSGPYISEDTYNALVKYSKTHPIGSERKLIDFPDGEEDLARDYRSGTLSLEQVFNRRSIFRGKDFVTRLSEYRFDYSRLPSVTEEQLLFVDIL